MISFDLLKKKTKQFPLLLRKCSELQCNISFMAVCLKRIHLRWAIKQEVKLKGKIYSITAFNLINILENKDTSHRERGNRLKLQTNYPWSIFCFTKTLDRQTDWFIEEPSPWKTIAIVIQCVTKNLNNCFFETESVFTMYYVAFDVMG